MCRSSGQLNEARGSRRHAGVDGAWLLTVHGRAAIPELAVEVGAPAIGHAVSGDTAAVPPASRQVHEDVIAGDGLGIYRRWALRVRSAAAVPKLPEGIEAPAVSPAIAG